jgi:hypothetical protein
VRELHREISADRQRYNHNYS